MTTLRPDQVDDWILGKANRAFSRHIQMDQGRLAKANPKDSGRMAASWRIAQGNPTRQQNLRITKVMAGRNSTAVKLRWMAHGISAITCPTPLEWR